MSGSFGIKVIRQDQKQRRNGEACRARLYLLLIETDELDIKRRMDGRLAILHPIHCCCIVVLRPW